MTPMEYRTAISAFVSQIDGRSPRVSTYISHGYISSGGEPAIDASVYTDWPHGERIFEVAANDFDELLTAIKDKWDAYKEIHRLRTIRNMAIAIIRITAEQGECTDAALRADVFSGEEVARHGPEACVEANKIAANGPFAIKLAAKANAA